MVVMAVIVAMIIMGLGRMGMHIAVGVVMMLDGVAARAARMGAHQSNDARKDRAEQRQENDCLDHIAPP
jgi:hypothetical protein